MAAFLRPAGLDEALALLAADPDLRPLAGATDLYAGPGAPDTRPLLDLTGIAALRGIDRSADGIRIGALTTWAEVQRAGLPPVCAALVAAGRDLGSPQVQNTATVAGNLCNASPAADGTVALLALDAEVEVAGPEGARRVPVAGFVTGPRRVALGPGELVVALQLPPRRGRSAFVKLGARRHLVISIAMVAARLATDSRGRIAEAAVAVGACSPVARRQPRLEAALCGLAPSAAATAVDPGLFDGLGPIDDIRAPAAYRADAVPVLVRRALADCLEG